MNEIIDGGMNEKVFIPSARNCPKNIDETYKCHESLKQLKYEHLISNVEKTTFSSLTFACARVSAPFATKVIKCIAAKISN